jgi:hypothetical protein
MENASCRSQPFFYGCAVALLLAIHASATTFTVMSTADAGGSCPGAGCTLRQAIATAGAGDTINFSPGLGTITLTSDHLLIDKDLTIAGPGANLLTVRRSSAGGTPQFRIFYLQNGFFPVNISGLTLVNGDTTSGMNTGGNAGGAILCVTFGNVTIAGCTISGNASDGGGGIFKSAAGGTMTVRDSTISGNTAITTGGGLYNSGSGNFGTVNVINSTISGNFAHNAGGIFNTGVVSLTNSTVSGNIASASLGSPNGSGGGGIFNSGFSTLNMTNSTVTGNMVNDSSFVGAVGGGIYNGSSAMMNLSNSTLAGNAVSSNGALNDGGGVYNEFNTVNCKSTIIAGNTAGRNGPDFLGPLTSQGYNLLGNNANTNITPTTGDQVGTPGAPINPLLGPLQNNGGPTFTRAPLTGSPAIDQGTSAGLAGQLLTDQRGVGYRRTVDDPSIPNAPGGNGTDIGAEELGAQINAVSRKSHAGIFYNIGLPLAGAPGIECRLGSGPGFDGHQVLVTFDSAVTVGGVAVTSAGGQAMGALSVSGPQVTVDLTIVANAQTLGITLMNVNDGTATGNVSIPMGLLVGDTNGDGLVNAGDTTQTRSRSGQTTTATNFRSDVNSDGTINSGDQIAVRSRSGTFLP